MTYENIYTARATPCAQNEDAKDIVSCIASLLFIAETTLDNLETFHGIEEVAPVMNTLHDITNVLSGAIGCGRVPDDATIYQAFNSKWGLGHEQLHEIADLLDRAVWRSN